MRRLSSLRLPLVLLSSALAVVLLASCALPDVGKEGNPCSDKGFCREGLVCSPKKLCVKTENLPLEDGGTGEDIGHDQDTGHAGDAGGDTGGDAAPPEDGGDDTGTDAGSDAGTDGGDPCATSNPCEKAPDPECIDGSTLRTYQPAGTCQDGVCINRPHDDTTCTFGCTLNKCNSDPGQDAGTDTGASADGGDADASTDGGADAATDGGADAGSGCQAQCGTGLACQGGACVHSGDYGEPCNTGDNCNGAGECNKGTCVASTCAGRDDFTLCKMVQAIDRSYDICVGGTCVSPGCGFADCNAPGPSFRLPDTNQRKCYGGTTEIACTAMPCNPDGSPQFCGQDAQYGWDTSHVVPERYAKTEVFAGEPLVRDNVTGLEWQGCPGGLSGGSCATGTILTKTWSDALAYCEALTWAGQTDWRLADRFELRSIAGYGRIFPSIDQAAFPATPGNYFWSSSSLASDTANAWYVSSSYGDVYDSDKTNTYDVRCVRGIPAPSPPRFSKTEPVPGYPIVADKTTGLQWQGCAAGLSGSACATGGALLKIWTDALAYCESLSLGDQTDWRLPGVGELDSIVDDRRTNPSIDTTTFPATPSSNFFWSSSSSAGDAAIAWAVDFNYGRVVYYNKVGPYAVRCVRSGKFDTGCTDYGGRLGWMCNVPDGAFQMGCNSAVDSECKADESPYHSVSVPTFKIDRHEVTAAEYKACVDGGGCTAGGTVPAACNYNAAGREGHPINCVTWDQSRAFCTWAGKRLPTEAEWEKAARGTDGRKFPWGNDVLDCDRAVHSVVPCSNAGSAAVGSKATGASPYGVTDMVGNVWEWVEDDTHSSYTGAPDDGSAWIDGPRATNRVMRGGAWDSVTPGGLRASYRGSYGATSKDSDTGFRCAVSQ